jgi:hypothetical protein
MDKELEQKLQNLKADGKKKKGCASCKKKKEVLEALPEIEDIEPLYIPTKEEIQLAYVELGNRDRNKVKPLIARVYSALFNEEFNFDCSSCVNAQARRLKNYIIEVLKIPV